MKTFYLYRLCVTGGIFWQYVESNYIDEVETKSKYLMGHGLAPNLPLHINSALYGGIKSEFDYNITLVPGLVRYGTTDDNSDIFKLKWMRDYYLLDINGYDAIQIFWKQTVIFVQNNIVIARMEPASGLKISYEYNTSDRIKYFEIDDKFISIMEILGAFIELQFAY